VDSAVKRLRARLREAAPDADAVGYNDLIVTVRDTGYKLNDV
jgi:DNA-binding response OmpR family regulator